MRIIEVQTTLDHGEVKISGYLTVAQVEQTQGNPDGFTIVLDDRKRGTKTSVPNHASNLQEALQAAGIAILGAAEDEGLTDMDNVWSSALVASWMPDAPSSGKDPELIRRALAQMREQVEQPVRDYGLIPDVEVIECNVGDTLAREAFEAEANTAEEQTP